MPWMSSLGTMCAEGKGGKEMKKERFLGFPNVTVPETKEDFEQNYDSYLIDTSKIIYFSRKDGLFEIVYRDEDKQCIIYSDFGKNLILAFLFECKIIRLINYWGQRND
jgi:hypothetical protein